MGLDWKTSKSSKIDPRERQKFSFDNKDYESNISSYVRIVEGNLTRSYDLSMPVEKVSSSKDYLVSIEQILPSEPASKSHGQKVPSELEFTEGDFRDSIKIMRSLDQSGFLLNENWDSSISLDAKVTEIHKDHVICICLIDRRSKLFEERIFPKSQLSHLDLKIGSLLVINIKSKAGSFRFDILDGSGLVDDHSFQLDEIYSKMEVLGLDKSIKL